MTLTLKDLSRCFEGVIPSIIATAGADGMPNVSYLSHVGMVDADHVALSNQFFAKTAANVRANPHAELLMVDGRSGQQYALTLRWERSEDRGALFEQMAQDLRATSAQIGMADVMRLRAVDIFRVIELRECLSLGERHAPEKPTIQLRDVSAATQRLAAQTSVEGLLDMLLESVRALAGCDSALILLHEPAQRSLITVASSGYDSTGAGAEAPIHEGLIGEAASSLTTFKLNDVTRSRRFTGAILQSAVNEDRSRSIALPELAGGMSQIAVPMVARAELRGVLFAESMQRLTFEAEVQHALELLCRQAAATLALLETDIPDGKPVPQEGRPPAPTDGRRIDVVSHAFDGSIFLDGAYVIKGVAGRLLRHLIERSVADGRTEFTNREIRLAEGIGLPDFKDNLETRLLLLRRRLDDKGFPMRIEPTGRGRFRLVLGGSPILTSR